MGSKGSNTTTQNQATSQTYEANPLVSGAGQQALTLAQGAASQPFQAPAAPVAGFSNDQQQAFQQYRNLQGSAQPYYDTAKGYFSPQGAQDFYNPMASAVMANMKDVFGQQLSQNNGKLTQAAGGVGADRIAVGQANLAKEQGLAAGQTMSNLWQQAAQNAQFAGQGQMALGQNVFNTNAQGAGALYGAGQAQQQQSQAELNSPYQQQLARLAYPFQTAQYLAGITGSLAPAFGGTTTGNMNSATTKPAPSMLSQLIGGGTAAAGLYGSFGGGSGKGSGTGDGSWYGPSSVGGAPLSGYAEGGGIDEEEPPQETEPYGTPLKGPGDVVPTVNLTPGAGHSAPLTGGIQFQQPQQESKGDSGGSFLGDIAKIAGSVATIAPMFSDRRLKEDAKPIGETYDGQKIYRYKYKGSDTPQLGMMADEVEKKHPEAVGEAGGYKTVDYKAATKAFGGGIPNFDDGGWALDDRFGAAFSGNKPKEEEVPWGKSSENYSFGKLASDVGGLFRSSPANAAPAAPAGPSDTFANRFGGFPTEPAIPPGEVNKFLTPREQALDALRMATTKPVRIDRGIPAPTGEKEIPEEAEPALGNKNSIPSDPVKQYMAPNDQMPYPDSTERDWGQKATRSPWMSLVHAGAAMMSTPGTFGEALGAGLKAGATNADSQRKELRSEEEINNKARALYQNARQHLDQYTKMTPYQREALRLRNKELDQEGNTKPTMDFKPAEITAAIKAVKEDPMNIGKSPEELRALVAKELAMRKALRGNGETSAAPPAGPAIGTEKEFDDGKGGKVVGVWDGSAWKPKK